MTNKDKGDKKPVIFKNPFQKSREVDFFLRLHRHLPDGYCGGSPLSGCKYRLDGVAINADNEELEKLHQNPEFVKKEKEVQKAVKKQHKEKTTQSGVTINCPNHYRLSPAIVTKDGEIWCEECFNNKKEVK